MSETPQLCPKYPQPQHLLIVKQVHTLFPYMTLELHLYLDTCSYDLCIYFWYASSHPRCSAQSKL
jgi:hypothetical protein